MNSLVQTLNLLGAPALQFAWSMLWQSSLLIALLFLLDLALRSRSRAAVRYALWLVLLVKLVLPPSLALPTSAAWWVLPNTTHLETTHKRQSYIVSYGPSSAPVTAREMPDAFVILASPKPRLSLAGWALASAVFFSSVLLVWMLLRWCQILRRARRATPAPLFLNQMAAATILETKLPNHVRIKFTDRPFSPAVCGLFRPIILFPIALANRLSPAQVRAVLLHEVFHLKRADVWVNLVQTVLQIAYWWHPLLWLANARIRCLREEAVDDCVMLALSDEADTYAPTLIEVAKMTLQRPLASLGLVGIVESKSSLRRRIERLMNFKTPSRAGLTLQAFVGILAFSVLVVPMGEAP